MLIRFKFDIKKDFINYDAIANKHNYFIKIIDQDFEEVVIGKGTPNCIQKSKCIECAHIEASFDAIINVYTRRNLNVARNLYLSFKQHNKYYSMKNIIGWYSECNFPPELLLELKKYLLFS